MVSAARMAARYLIERGYEDFYMKLRSLGAIIERLENADERSEQKFRLKYA